MDNSDKKVRISLILTLTDSTLLTENRWVEWLLYSVVAFFIPFILGGPQFLVGFIVNAILVLGAMNLRDYRLIPLIILPSLGAFSRGLLFGPFTLFLAYLIPFIWIGNFILVTGIKNFVLYRKWNRLVALLVSAVIKAAWLFVTAYVLYTIGLIPEKFLTFMGLFQLLTALSGGIAAFLLHEVKKRIQVD